MMSKNTKTRVALGFGFIFVLMIIALICYEQASVRAAMKASELSKQVMTNRISG